MADATTFENQNKEIPYDVSLMVASQPIDKDLNDTTYTFEVQSEANTTRKDRLPSTSLHVLEEISADEHIDVVELDNEQDTTAAVFEHDAMQTHHVANTSNDDAEVTISSQVPIVQPEAHTTKNI